MSLPNDPIRPGLGEPESVHTTGTTGASKGDVAKQQAAEVTAEARERATDVAGTAKQGAGEVAGTAKEGAAHVAGVAKDEARQVAEQAGAHLQSLFGQARQEFTAQAGTQQGQIAATLGSLGRGLEGLTFGDEPTDRLAGDLARQASERLNGLGTWLEQREPADVLDEVRRFARRRPGTFLAAAALTGLIAGRLTRGMADEARQDDARGYDRQVGGYSRYAGAGYDQGRYGYEQGRYGYDQGRYGYEQGRYGYGDDARYTTDASYGHAAGTPVVPAYQSAQDVQPAYGEATAEQPAYRGDNETTITPTQGFDMPGHEGRR